MALITFCRVCKNDTLHSGMECLECKSKVTRDKKEEFLSGRKNLSLEERISLIESQNFDILEKLANTTNRLY